MVGHVPLVPVDRIGAEVGDVASHRRQRLVGGRRLSCVRLPARLHDDHPHVSDRVVHDVANGALAPESRRLRRRQRGAIGANPLDPDQLPGPDERRFRIGRRGFDRRR